MAWVTNEDGDPYWTDDYIDEPVAPVGEEPDESEAEGRRLAAAEGISYEDYLAGTKDTNYSHEGRNDGTLPVDDNQSEAEVRRLKEMNAGTRGLGNITSGSDVTRSFDVSGVTDLLSKMGIKSPDGSIDWSKLLAGLGGALTLADGLTSKPTPIRTIAELKAGMSAMNTPDPWTDAELTFGRRAMQTGSALPKASADSLPSAMVKAAPITRHFADGGEVDEGALSQAFAGGVRGMDGGQSDLIDAKLSPGEYVLDAETVSALGDGNTDAGIAKLDELRRNLREQKRSAPVDEIPPEAHGPLSYIGGR